MKRSVLSEAPSLLLILAMFVLTAASWPAAPDRIPMHWNGAGAIDRTGGRVEGLLLLPLVATAIYVLMLVLPRLDPRREHYDAFAGPYALMRTAIIGLIFTVDVAVHLAIRGRSVNMAALMPVAAGVFFIVLGNYLPKIRSNWFVGIRTPWTLSSEHAWEKTHRFGGWLLVACGATIVLSALLWPPVALTVVFPAAILTFAVLSVVYSYFAWRHDPARG